MSKPKVVQRAIERYRAPTPVRYRAYGRFMMIIGTTMQVALQGMGVHRNWTIVIAILTAIGTALPELAVINEQPTEQPTKQE